jgi:glycosyltransferase involved in cell wall biosynthesis
VRESIAIVLPVFNDWEPLLAVLHEIAHASDGCRHRVILVDDGSSADPPAELAELARGGRIGSMELIQLAVNLGHQRAIAVGLSAVAERDDLAAVIVMDSDGEDRPSDIATLVTAFGRYPGHVVLAQRAHRQEDWLFRAGYLAYKMLFRMLTGKTIDFGNFCLLPMAAVRRLVRMPELWNNLAAAVMRSRLRFQRVPIDRGRRIAGRSHMNLPALVLHGLSAMSVYTDLIFVRVLLAASAAGAAAVAGLAGVIAVRFTTDYAIPGWASMVFGDLLIILSQSFVMVVASTLALLGSRSQRSIVPLADAGNFVASRRELTPPVRPKIKAVA